MRRKIAAAGCLLLLTVQFMSCELFLNRPVLIRLPDFPVDSDGISLKVVSWLVEYPVKTVDGSPEYNIETVAADTPCGGTELLVSIARGINLPVLARPVFSAGGGALQRTGNFPAGAIYPADADGLYLDLQWEAGFACELIQSCCGSFAVLQSFDTIRFRDDITERAAGLTDESGRPLSGGCWLIDPVPVKARLGYGLYRKSSLAAAELLNFGVPAGPGIYISDNPFFPPLQLPADGGVMEITAPAQRRTAYICPETGEAAIVFFDEKQWCWTNLLTQESESGRR